MSSKLVSRGRGVSSAITSLSKTAQRLLSAFNHCRPIDHRSLLSLFRRFRAKRSERRIQEKTLLLPYLCRSSGGHPEVILRTSYPSACSPVCSGPSRNSHAGSRNVLRVWAEHAFMSEYLFYVARASGESPLSFYSSHPYTGIHFCRYTHPFFGRCEFLIPSGQVDHVEWEPRRSRRRAFKSGASR